jgi:exopolysaccharide biosynthesis protein
MFFNNQHQEHAMNFTKSLKKTTLSIFAGIFLLGISVIAEDELYKSKWEHKSIAKGIDLYSSNSKFFNKLKLNINVLKLSNNAKKDFRLALAYVPGKRIITSKHCIANKAIAGINGGYFNMKEKTPCAYLKVNGKSATKLSKRKKPLPTVINGAVVVSNSGIVKLEPARTDAEYNADNSIKTVLITGPVLIFKGEKIDLKLKSDPRHPRSAIGITKDNKILLVAIDGRAKESAGVSWKELQDLMMEFGCTEAINLDGGGSTTLWLKDKVINMPSDNKKFDNKGERSVSNALIVIPTETAE